MKGKILRPDFQILFLTELGYQNQSQYERNGESYYYWNQIHSLIWIPIEEKGIFIAHDNQSS